MEEVTFKMTVIEGDVVITFHDLTADAIEVMPELIKSNPHMAFMVQRES